jgi:hypothetical protein
MPGKKSRSWTWMPLLAGAVLVVDLAIGEQPGRGQVAKDLTAQPAQDPTKRTPLPNRTSLCRNCHDQGSRLKPAYSEAEMAEMICRMTELQYYDKGDKHKIAYAQLASERSRNMVKLLGYKNKDESFAIDGTSVGDCLRCHALPEVGKEPVPPEFLADGVTCVACHGAYQEWVDQHADAVTLRALRKQRGGKKDEDPKNWLNLTRKQKEDLKGMTDLWNPVRRTEICASCHIGNYKEKKVVTHAMYAAGHPPLPSFEPASFSDLEPPHWQYLSEQTKAQRDRLQPCDESNLERAELVAISGPMMLRQSMRLFADAANGTGDNHSGPGWPDFARYDCRACHHELKSELKDSAHDEPFAPGRPSEPKWVHVLARVGITGLTDTSEASAKERVRYETLVKKLREAMSAEPFGTGIGTREAAAKLAAWAEELVEHRPKAPFDAKRAWPLLIQLCEEGATKSLDYDSARQLAWAFRAIYHDVIPDDKQRDRNPDIERILSELEGALFLNLSSAKEKTAIEDSLAKRLGQAALFDRAATAALFAALKPFVARH